MTTLSKQQLADIKIHKDAYRHHQERAMFHLNEANKHQDPHAWLLPRREAQKELIKGG